VLFSKNNIALAKTPSTPRNKDVCLMTHCFSVKNQIFLCVLGVFARDKITFIYPPDQGKSRFFREILLISSSMSVQRSRLPVG